MLLLRKVQPSSLPAFRQTSILQTRTLYNQLLTRRSILPCYHLSKIRPRVRENGVGFSIQQAGAQSNRAFRAAYEVSTLKALLVSRRHFTATTTSLEQDREPASRQPSSSTVFTNGQGGQGTEPHPPPDSDAQQRHYFQENERFFRSYHYSKLACWTVIALFGLVYVGRAGIAFRVDEPGKSTDQAATREKAQRQAVSASKPGLWSDKIWTYRAGEFPPKTSTDYIPYFASTFAHGSVIHLLANSFGFYQLGVALMPLFGIAPTLLVFASTGFAGSLVDAAAGQAYAQGRWGELFALVKAEPDPNPSRTLNVSHLGASGGLAAMASIVAFSTPRSRWAFPFIPVPMPAWFLFAGLMTYDSLGFYNNFEDGIGHGAHLAGYLCGAVVWLGVLRWTGFGQLVRGVAKFRGK